MAHINAQLSHMLPPDRQWPGITRQAGHTKKNLTTARRSMEHNGGSQIASQVSLTELQHVPYVEMDGWVAPVPASERLRRAVGCGWGWKFSRSHATNVTNK